MIATHIKAVDWGTYLDAQLSPDTPWQFVTADLIGFVVAEDDDKIVLAMQVFTDGDYRGVLVIPQRCILHRTELVGADATA